MKYGAAAKKAVARAAAPLLRRGAHRAPRVALGRRATWRCRAVRKLTRRPDDARVAMGMTIRAFTLACTKEVDALPSVDTQSIGSRI